jgi:hypothetical protein
VAVAAVSMVAAVIFFYLLKLVFTPKGDGSPVVGHFTSFTPQQPTNRVIATSPERLPHHLKAVRRPDRARPGAR